MPRGKKWQSIGRRQTLQPRTQLGCICRAEKRERERDIERERERTIRKTVGKDQIDL